MSNKIRKWAWWALLGVSGVAILPVLSQFFVALAAEFGLYDSPSDKVVKVIDFLSSFLESPVFIGFFGLVIGATFGFWLDKTLRHREVASGARLDLQFYGRKRPPKVVTEENIFRHYILEYQNYNIADHKTIDIGTWIFIVFETPIIPGRIEIGSDDIVLPPHTAEHFSERCAILTFEKFLDPGTLKIKVQAKK